MEVHIGVKYNNIISGDTAVVENVWLNARGEAYVSCSVDNGRYKMRQGFRAVEFYAQFEEAPEEEYEYMVTLEMPDEDLNQSVPNVKKIRVTCPEDMIENVVNELRIKHNAGDWAYEMIEV